MPSGDLEPWASRVVAALASTTAAAVTTLYSPEFGAALTAIQPAVAEAAARGIGRMLEHARRDAKLTVQELFTSLAASDEGLVLLDTALDAAQRTAHGAKLRALGRCLAAASGDGARIDQEALLVAAVAVLQPAHMRLLAVMGYPHSIEDDAGRSRPVQVWSLSLPEQYDSTLTLAEVEGLMGFLVAQGLAVSSAGEGLTFGPDSYRLTAFGRLLYERARQSAAEPTGTSAE